VGVVGDGELGRLLAGVDPVSGEVLRSPIAERVVTVTRLDPDGGAPVVEEQRLSPVTGFDLVFSCPKSVSLLHALTDDERVRRAVSEAHEQAWQSALGYLEHEACVVRRGHAGVVREQGEGFVAAAFRHRTSRAQDPHLHTHVIVANLARTHDGEWRALDGRAVLQTYRMAAGYLYEAQLRANLTASLGVAWREPHKGMGELDGVPEVVLRAFSTRRKQLVEHLAAHGLEGFAAARAAALATREAKESVDLAQLRERWRARAAELGLGQRELAAVIGRTPRRPPVFEEIAQRLLAPEGLTEKHTTFSHPDLVCALAAAHPQGCAVETVLELARELADLPAVRRIDAAAEPGRPPRYTTAELLAVEQAALDAAERGDGHAPVVELRVAASAATRVEPRLSAEQRRLVREVATRDERVVCVIGHAGAGKTTALRALCSALDASDIPTLGAAPSGRAADELASATGIPACTLHRLLIDTTRADGLPQGCLVIVDEAGMADTRTLAPLIHAVRTAEGKLLLVGDPAQLPAVGAGGLFAALCDRHGALELSDNHRQLDASERQALRHLRNGEPEQYLAWAASHGRLHIDDDPLAARARLLADWWHHAEHDLPGSVMIAHHRSDVAELNQAARSLLRSAGRLGHDELALSDRSFAVGDRVICRRNDVELGVRNGTRGTLVSVDAAERSVELISDRGQRRTLAAAYLEAGHLAHGYALTGHAMQGATVRRAFVVASESGALAEWGYVACSRARARADIYLATGDSRVRAAALDRLNSALARTSAECLAHDAQRSGATPILTGLRAAASPEL
jgi:conjugative relaxase-like TrwC/TraI family protein